MIRPLCPAILLALACAAAQAGTLKTITIDGDYSDWADVPVLDSDGGDNSGGPDIGVTKIANDGAYLYIYNTFPNNIELSTHTAIDIDSNPATGFDPFGLGLIGTEAAWQNDFGYAQDAGVFNNGLGLSGEFFGGGHALLDDFANGPARELAISLSSLFGGSLAPVFPDGLFNLLFWSDQGVGSDGIPRGFLGDAGLNGDVSGVIQYQLAEVPEPASIVTLAAIMSGTLLLRRKW